MTTYTALKIILSFFVIFNFFVKDSEKKSVNFDFSTPVSTAALHIDLTITCASSDTVHLTSCSTKKTEIGHALYTSKIIDETWGLGRCWIGDVSFESAAYVARYIVKKVTGERAEAYYVGRKPEYTTMSRRPGIGTPG